MDLRKRPARLKVDGLLQDFGYAELSPSVAEAIEARLARVGLQVAPSLLVAGSADIITIGRLVLGRAPVPPPRVAGRGSTAGPPAPPPPLPPAAPTRASPAIAPPAADREPELVAARLQLQRLRAELDTRVRVMESQVAARERELSDARAEAERLRAELELAVANQGGAAAEAQLAEQKAMLQGEPGELAELAGVLHDTRAALTATQQEIRQVLQDLAAEDVAGADDERDVVAGAEVPTTAATDLPEADAQNVDPAAARTFFQDTAEERPRRRGLPGRRR